MGSRVGHDENPPRGQGKRVPNIAVSQLWVLNCRQSGSLCSFVSHFVSHLTPTLLLTSQSPSILI